MESEKLFFFCLYLLMSQYSAASFFSLMVILVVETNCIIVNWPNNRKFHESEYRDIPT